MKKSVAVIVVLLLAFSLFGCSPGADRNSDKGQGASNATEVTLKIGLPGGYDITKKEIIEGFQKKHPEIKVEAEEAPWGDFVQQIVTRIAGDTAPDVWFQENAIVLGYGARGVAEDLTPYIERDLKEEEFVSELFSAETPDGKVFGVPHGINPIALAYNKRLFKEADVPFPTDDWTFDDLIKAAQKLTQDTNGDGKTDIYGFDSGWGITQGWFPWIKAAGGKVLDESLTKAMFTDPKTIEGVTRWSEMINKLKVSPTKEFKEAAGDELFGNEKAAMRFLQYSGQVHMNEKFPDVDYDTVKMPKGFDGNERVVPVVINSWLIYSKADPEVKEAAWKFIKYYLSNEAQQILADSGTSLPIKKEALESVEKMTSTNPSNKAAYTKGVEEAGVTMDENPTWQEWVNDVTPIFEDILQGIVSPKDGLEEINKRVQKILDEDQ